MIEVKEISKYYGSIQALSRVSFSLSRGEVVGFLGPNGAGKTTTMRILAGFIPPSEGECVVARYPLATQGLEARKKIGYLPESTVLYGDMETTDYLRYVGLLRRMSLHDLSRRAKEVIEICGLTGALGKKIATLSKGFRQRVGLAQALLHDPEVLILDEPTIGLDPNQIVEIRNLITRIGQFKTILLSTHILSEVEQVCQRVIIVSDGKIVGQGTPQELIHATEGVPLYYVGIRGDENEVLEGIRGLPHLAEAKKLASSNGVIHLKITFNTKQDLGEEIFKLCAARKWPLSELRREKITLEEVFKKLTR